MAHRLVTMTGAWVVVLSCWFVACGGPGLNVDGPHGVSGATPAAYEPGVFEALQSERMVVIHCGNSMRPGAEALAAAFQKQTGIGVRFNFGGSSQLIAAIELGEQGDLYLPHDPYAAMLDSKGLLDRYIVLGHVEPVIVVPLGNPKNISGLRDLTGTGIRVGLTDPRYATAGKLTFQAFAKMGLSQEFAVNIAIIIRGQAAITCLLPFRKVDVSQENILPCRVARPM